MNWTRSMNNSYWQCSLSQSHKIIGRNLPLHSAYDMLRHNILAASKCLKNVSNMESSISIRLRGENGTIGCHSVASVSLFPRVCRLYRQLSSRRRPASYLGKYCRQRDKQRLGRDVIEFGVMIQRWNIWLGLTHPGAVSSNSRPIVIKLNWQSFSLTSSYSLSFVRFRNYYLRIRRTIENHGVSELRYL